MTMDVEFNPPVVNLPDENGDQTMDIDIEQKDIMDFLTEKEEICFKSQQRGERDLTKSERGKIATDIFNKSKLNFLTRFGSYLTTEHLHYMKKFATPNHVDFYEVDILLNDLLRNSVSGKNNRNVKNRRYEALKEMITDGTYFSEVEMMKRNPLLYDQLVGQYLSEDEIKERDRYKMDEQTSFVKILMEGIEREDAESKRKEQENYEDNAVEEEDTDSEENDDRMMSRSPSPKPGMSLWGEFEGETVNRSRPKGKAIEITDLEKKLLNEEFITSMYQSFLDGADEDFDYNNVDNNSKYDNLEIINHDEEDKYFDSEEPAEAVPINDCDKDSEDELDIFMSALNNNEAVNELSRDLENINT